MLDFRRFDTELGRWFGRRMSCVFSLDWLRFWILGLGSWWHNRFFVIHDEFTWGPVALIFEKDTVTAARFCFRFGRHHFHCGYSVLQFNFLNVEFSSWRIRWLSWLRQHGCRVSSWLDDLSWFIDGYWFLLYNFDIIELTCEIFQYWSMHHPNTIVALHFGWWFAGFNGRVLRSKLSKQDFGCR